MSISLEPIGRSSRPLRTHLSGTGGADRPRGAPRGPGGRVRRGRRRQALHCLCVSQKGSQGTHRGPLAYLTANLVPIPAAMGILLTQQCSHLCNIPVIARRLNILLRSARCIAKLDGDVCTKQLSLYSLIEKIKIFMQISLISC